MFCNRKKYVESQQNTKTLLAFNSSYQLSYKEHLDLTNEISPYQLCLNPKTTDVHKCLDQLSLGIINDVPIVSKCGCKTQYYNLFVIDSPKTKSTV